MRKISNIGVVLVTYNRLEKLKKTLDYYEKQTVLPKYIIVVNNASTDNTKNFLGKWKKEDCNINKIVINSLENLGGSGGFYIGQKEALKLDAEWVMVADDDAYPHLDYLEKAMNIIDIIDENEVSVICGKVLELGQLCQRFKLNTVFNLNLLTMMSPIDYKKQIFSIDAFGYVGPIMNIKKLEKVGLINKDFFIWADDLEHSIRLKKVGEIICCSSLIIEHDVDRSNYKLSWKDYYGVRNRLYLVKTLLPNRYPWVLLITLLKTFLGVIIKGKSLIEVRLRLTAIKDAWNNKLGKHKIYKPGWKPDKK